MRAKVAPKCVFLSKTLGKILPSVGPFSAVSAITSLFWVRFRPKNYQTEGLHVFFQMMVKRSTNSRHSSAMALVKPWSNLPKPSYLWNAISDWRILACLGIFQPVLPSIESPRFACRKPGKILRVKMGLWQCVFVESHIWHILGRTGLY